MTPDYIICLEDGKKLKMLKRHLSSAYNMTPDQYRERWGLPADYPMVAPGYAQQRSNWRRRSASAPGATLRRRRPPRRPRLPAPGSRLRRRQLPPEDRPKAHERS